MARHRRRGLRRRRMRCACVLASAGACEATVGGLPEDDVGEELQLRTGGRTVVACAHQERRCRMEANVKLGHRCPLTTMSRTGCSLTASALVHRGQTRGYALRLHCPRFATPASAMSRPAAPSPPLRRSAGDHRFYASRLHRTGWLRLHEHVRSLSILRFQDVPPAPTLSYCTAGRQPTAVARLVDLQTGRPDVWRADRVPPLPCLKLEDVHEGRLAT